jgi:GT2 family glycosyltransferase
MTVREAEQTVRPAEGLRPETSVDANACETIAPAPRVCVMVLNYNGRDYLPACLQSLRRLRYQPFEVWVIDNASADGSVEILRSDFPEVRLLANDTNLGFSIAYDRGFEQALAAGFDFVWVLNHDTVVDPDALTALMEVALGDEKIGILGPKIYFADRPDTIWFAGGAVSLATGITRHYGLRQRDRGQHDQVRDVDYVTGAAMLVRRTVLERLGGFDPIFSPAYGEDADLCLRARKEGFRVVYVPQAKVWHKVSAATGGGLTPEKARLKVRHSFLLYKRHARWYHWISIPFFVALGLVVEVGRQLASGNIAAVGALFAGFWDVLRGRAG